jgi:N-acetylglucosaminyl-diphospho-decaprenol L-rhamnosyltransferase
MLSAVIVTYNSSAHIVRCLESLRGKLSEIVVVDNASLDSTASLISKRFPSVKLIASEANLGFAAASNLGARQSTGSVLVFLNPDTICLDPLTPLEEALARDANLSAVAPRLVGADGRTQLGFTVRRLPTLTSLVFETLLLNRLFPRNPVNRRYLCLDLDLARQQHVEQPAGACILIRRELFESLGGFDESFFPLWFEDVDLCKRLHRSGFPILFLPQVRIEHSGGHSLDSVMYSEKQIYWYRNMLYYVTKHFSWVAGVVLRGALLAGMGLRAMAEFTGSRAKTQNTSRRERLGAYWKAAKLAFCRLDTAATGRSRSAKIAQISEGGWLGGK